MTLPMSYWKALIDKHGKENLLSIQFDNNSNEIFSNDEQADNLLIDDENFVFVEYDSQGNPFYSYKPAYTVKGLIFKPEGYTRNDYRKFGSPLRDINN